MISVRDTDPAAAKAVVTALVDLFVGNGTEAKQRDSSEAGSFIDDQIKTYEIKLSEATVSDRSAWQAPFFSVRHDQAPEPGAPSPRRARR